MKKEERLDHSGAIKILKRHSKEIECRFEHMNHELKQLGRLIIKLFGKNYCSYMQYNKICITNNTSQLSNAIVLILHGQDLSSCSIHIYIMTL